MNEKCEKCWKDIRHNVLNGMTEIGLRVRRALVYIDPSIKGYKQIYEHLDAITERVLKIEEFIKERFGGRK